MTKKAVIRLGDSTDHGGTVISSFTDFRYQDIPLAGIGHMVTCPKCKGVFPIIEGSEKLIYAGVKVALEGMQTACGAKLIATQQEYTISTISMNEAQVNNEKIIKNIYWSYGEEKEKIDEVSRFYVDLNIHIETQNYQEGEIVEVTINDGELEFLVYASVDAKGNAEVLNVFAQREVIIKKDQ